MLQKPKGTKDILPEESYIWNYVERVAEYEVFENYGFKEIRIPTFEYTELFQRGVGDTTDIVQKEMYTFEDKGGRSLTLRPEGTAGIIRAYIENGLSSKASPLKLWYKMPVYRYENVQKGRDREFNQLGCEILGSSSYLADVEVITAAYNILKSLNLEKKIELNINSIGCPTCRREYQKALKNFIGEKLDEYCDTCKTRFEKNPMRILDCKEEKCRKLNEGAPIILDYLCEECSKHFENVKSMLSDLEIKYNIDPRIVRGLDYYTKTVFEFISKEESYTVIGGGRYDGLVKELGGQDTPAVGFGLGEERLISLVSNNNEIKDINTVLYIATMGEEKQIIKALKLSSELRKYLPVETDINSRSFNAQLKYANKIHAENLLVIGEDELKNNSGKIKNMETGKEYNVELNANEIFETILNIDEENE